MSVHINSNGTETANGRLQTDSLSGCADYILSYALHIRMTNVAGNATPVEFIDGSNQFFWLRIEDGNVRLRTAAASDTTFSPGVTFSTNTWYTLVVSKTTEAPAAGELRAVIGESGGALSLYSNGSAMAGSGYSSSPATIRLGADIFSNAMTGQVVGFRVWGRGLSDAEMYREARSIWPQSYRSLVGNWPLLNVGTGYLTSRGGSVAMSFAEQSVAPAASAEMPKVAFNPRSPRVLQAEAGGAGTQTISGGSVVLSPTAGAAVVTTGAVTISGGSVVLAPTAGAATVTPGAVTITGASTVLAVSAGAAVVSPGAVTIAGASTVLAPSAGAAVVSPGAVTIAGASNALSLGAGLAVVSNAGDTQTISGASTVLSLSAGAAAVLHLYRGPGETANPLGTQTTSARAPTTTATTLGLTGTTAAGRTGTTAGGTTGTD